MPSRSEVQVVVPVGIDDPRRPSGGNTYDRRVLAGLPATGWPVRQHRATPESLGSLLATLPVGAVVLVDGLLACRAPGALQAQRHRLRVVVLLHQVLGTPDERAALKVATGVVTTSAWAARQVAHRLVRVALPGVDPAPLVAGSRSGARLLCVAAVLPAKGQDVLLEALEKVADLDWQLDLVGSLERRPDLVAELRGRAAASGLAERVRFRGPLVGRSLESSYAAADVLVLPTRQESYGMVVAEALARGLPVIASDVGGVPEALGPGRPGVLVPPEDPATLAHALRLWLERPPLRASLRARALVRRTTLTGWDETSRRVADALAEVAA